jgi:hypothetical protein
MAGEWWKYIPHPTYGHYCGMWAKKGTSNSPEPIDDLDKACLEHDVTENDRLFALRIRQPLYISSLYGKIYHWFAKLVFRKG